MVGKGVGGKEGETREVGGGYFLWRKKRRGERESEGEMGGRKGMKVHYGRIEKKYRGIEMEYIGHSDNNRPLSILGLVKVY